MKKTQPITKAILLLFFILLAFPKKAYAYLDPGSGSFLFQLLIGALFGGLFAVKIYWKKVRSFFSNLFFGKKNEEKKTSER